MQGCRFQILPGVIKQNALAREANPQLLTQVWPLFKSRTGTWAWRKTRKPTLEHELRGHVIFPFYLAKQKFQEMENNPNRKCIQTVWDGVNGRRFTTGVHSAFIRLSVLPNRTILWSTYTSPHANLIIQGRQNPSSSKDGSDRSNPIMVMLSLLLIIDSRNQIYVKKPMVFS